MNDFGAVLGTAVTLASCMGAAGLFILRAVIAKDLRPLSDTMLRLTLEMQSLASTISQYRTDAKEQREEWHGTIGSIRDMLDHHQAQLGSHETRLTVIEQTHDSRPARRTS
jgi:hypothetical protein